MPNPTGTNNMGTSSSVFTRESAYGASGQMEQLKRAAEMAGQQTANSNLNSGRRAQRQAAGGKSAVKGISPQPVLEARQPAGPPEQIPEPSLDSYHFFLWGEISNHPEASPLVKQMYEASRARVGRG